MITTYFVLLGKIFNLFALVKFSNDDCRGDALQNPEASIGTCYTSSGKPPFIIFISPIFDYPLNFKKIPECTDRAGRAVGNCASGFGICCIFDSFMCGDTIFQNKSYIR